MTTVQAVDYFVTIDSEFRDNEKYPIETDFAVKFKETTSDVPFVKGVPVSNDYFLPLQIDPNGIDTNFRVNRGTILNIKQIDTTSFILCGLMQPQLGDFGLTFSIETYQTSTQSSYKIIEISSPTVDNEVYLCKISYVSQTYVSNWFIFMRPTPYGTGLNKSIYSNFTIDTNNNIYWTFDFSAPQFEIRKISGGGSVIGILAGSTIFSIQNPSVNNNNCLALFAFDINGVNFYVNGHDWGYHIIEGSNDIISTASNGKIGIQIDTANNVYLASNTNPYEPTIYSNLIYQTFGEQYPINQEVIIFKDISNNDNVLIYLQYNTTAEIRTFNIQESGTTELTYNTQIFSNYYNFVPECTYFFQSGTTCYIVANYYSTSEININVSAVDLTTGILTLTGIVTPYQQLNNSASYRISSVKYGNTIFTAFVYTNNNLGPYQVRILKLDLTNLAAGFSVVATSSSITLTASDISISLTTFINNDIVYIIVTNEVGDLNILKGQVTSTTFTFLNNFYSNTLITVPLLELGSFVYYQSSKYYLVLGAIDKSITSIYDITDATIPIKLSNIETFTCKRVSLYIKDGSYFLVDFDGNIYNVTNPAEPVLIYSEYPTLNSMAINYLGGKLRKFNVWCVSEQYEKEFGLLDTFNSFPTPLSSEYLVNFPFVYKDVSIKSIHYNQNLENQFGGSDIVAFDTVNSVSSSNNIQNGFTPSTFKGNGLIAWYDASDGSTISTDYLGVTEWRDKSGNNYNLAGGVVGFANRPQYDSANKEINIGYGAYLQHTGSNEITPKYIAIVSKRWDDNTSLSPYYTTSMLQIGDTKKFGLYKNTNTVLPSSKNIIIAEVPATTQTYTYTSSTNDPLVLTGDHPYLFQTSYETNTGVYELIYNQQTTYGYNFDGVFSLNNQNTQPNPLNSTGWSPVTSNIILGCPFVDHSTFSLETVYGPTLPLSGANIVVNNPSTFYDYFNGSISEIIILDFVPNETIRKQIQAYLYQKYNLWIYYIGSNPYKSLPAGSVLTTVNGINLTYNFYDYNDIMNIQLYSASIPIINQSYDPNSLFGINLSYTNIIKFTHIRDSDDNIWFFLCFSYNTSPTNGAVYLALLKTSTSYTVINNTYIQLRTFNPSTDPVPVSNIFLYNDAEFNNEVRCLVQYIQYPHTIEIYNYTSNLNLIFTFDFSYNDSSWLQTAGGYLLYLYPTTQIYKPIFFVVMSQPSSWDSTYGYNGSLLLYDTRYDSTRPLIENLKLATNKYGLETFLTSQGQKYVYIRGLAGSEQTYIVDVTIEANLFSFSASYKIINGWKFSPAYNPNSYTDINWNLGNEVPLNVFLNPVDQNIYGLYNYNSTDVNSLTVQPNPPLNIQQYFSYKNLTNIDNIPGSNLIPLTFTNLGYRIGLIKYSISGQKVYATLLVSDSTAQNVIYLQCYDITNIVFATTYYKNASGTPTQTYELYDGLHGIGLAFINKINIAGNSEWLNYLGGDLSTTNSLNVNIANIDISPDLTYIYACGGWSNKIESFDTTNSKKNKIYNIGSDYNGFVTKVILKDGSFEWLLPSIGSNEDYFENIHYINSKNLIGIVTHFQSPILLVYEPQISSSGPYTNPERVNLNLANTSSETSSLVVFKPDGSIQYSTKLYSNLAIQSIQLYDIYVDEDSVKKRIVVSGVTNATVINSIDSTGLETQILYNNINQFTQKSIILYQYDLDGIYKSSQNIICPPTLLVNTSSVRSFSLLNRTIVFANTYAPDAVTSDLYVYNQDGSFSKSIASTDFSPTYDQSYLFLFYYDNTFVDENGVSYSRIIIPYSELIRKYHQYPYKTSLTSELKGGYLPLPQTANALVNYNVFIMGSLFENTYISQTSQTLIADTTTLNKNFSIRSNYVDPDNNNYVIILNQEIPSNSFNKKNLPIKIYDTDKNYWTGSVVKSILNSIVAYDTNFVPNASNTLTLTNIYGNILDITKQYYLMLPNYVIDPMTYDIISLTTTYITVSNVTYNSTSKIYTLTLPSTVPLQNIEFTSGYYGPYVYLGVQNLNANYTIQFCPTPLRTEARFKVKLNSLIIPNRKIKNSYLGGIRDLNDFRYLVLEVYNENDVESFSETINSNDFFNNPNYISYINRCKGTFTLPITGIDTNSTSNFIILNSVDIPVVTFLPGYYNIHIKLKDIYGNIVQFDSTPNGAKTSDAIFTGNIVDSPLMQITANLTFTKN